MNMYECAAKQLKIEDITNLDILTLINNYFANNFPNTFDKVFQNILKL